MLIGLYLAAIVAANLSVAAFGPRVVILNSFLFIGLDLVTRDALHTRWHGRGLVRRMALLIAAGGALSWVLNRNAGPIALASTVAAAAKATVDALVYQALRDRGWYVRTNGSNLPAAIVDSVVFLVLAFGPGALVLAPLQVLAKVAGGALWSVILNRPQPYRADWERERKAAR